MSRQIDYERKNLILEMVDFFNKHKVDYLLGGGTACKFLEEKEIYKPLGKNHDIDFHVWVTQREEVQKGLEGLEKDGFEIRDQNYKIQLFKSGLIVEILFLFREGKTLYFQTTDSVNNGRQYFPKECFMKQAKIIDGVEVSLITEDYCKYKESH